MNATEYAELSGRVPVTEAVRAVKAHGLVARVADGAAFALLAWSRRTERGIEFGEDWEEVPLSSRAELLAWLGY